LIFITFIPVLAMYVLTSDFIPLVEVIKSYPTEIDEQTLRFSENRLPYLVQISFELFRRILLPLAVIYAYVKSNLYHGRWTLYFWISFVLTAIVCAATLDRGPIIILIVMIMFVRYFVLKKTDLRIYFFGLFLVSFFGALISLLQYQREILFDVFIQYSFYILGWRIFIDPVSMAGLAFEQFNASTGFLYGESVRLFSLIVPSIEYIDSQGGSNHREWSAAPATFVGDLWRNFSWVGVIIGTFLLGAVYQFIQIFFIRNQNIVTICAFIILMMYPLFIIHGNMFGIVTTMIFIVGLILSVIGSTITLPNCKVYANDNHSKN